MISYQEIVESYKKLQIVLENLLQEQKPKLTVSQDGDYPLLILETSSDSVGFAIVTGKPKSSFTSAYDTFKKLYRKKHTTWKERNLSFVICRSGPQSTNDAFFSSLETDVYFCRKYVIILYPDQYALKQELLQLPFLPLPESRIGGVLRPPSAQTLLQNLNLSAQLARQIIAPKEYSANSLVNQFLAGKETLPSIDTKMETEAELKVRSTESTRIKKVTIEAFRAYKKKQEFDVDADIIVLYGPNGLGKTSFFDSIDYVCTGRIGRLCHHRMSQKRFIEIARHLDASARNGYVSMKISNGTNNFSVKRGVMDWGNALIDTEKYDRASALQFLTLARWGPKKARIENLERLFRATHLFSQTEPELLVEFEQDSTLSSDLVYRMLALDDYASGLRKVSEILAQMDKQIEQNKQHRIALKAKTKEIKSRIQEIAPLSDTMQASGQILKMATELLKELHDYIRFKVDETESTFESVHEWRAFVESILEDARDNLLLLQEIKSSFAQFEKNGILLQETTSELSKLEGVLKEKTNENKQQLELKKKLENRLEQDRAVLMRLKSRLVALGELSGLHDVFKKTGSSLRHWKQELKRVVSETETTTAELQPLLPVAENLHSQIAELQEFVHAKSQEIEALDKIIYDLPSWEKKRTRMISLQQDYNATQSNIQATKDIIEELETEIAIKEQEFAKCKLEYNQLETNKLELTYLLDEIERHVENGFCPTCGADHKSKSALINRIHAQKKSRPAYLEKLSKRYSELQSVLKQDRESLAVRNNEQAFSNSELQEMANELAEVRASIELFERTVMEAGLSVDQSLATNVMHKKDKEEKACQSSLDKIKKLESELANNTKQIKRLEQKLSELEAAIERAELAIAPLEKQIATLQNKTEKLNLSLEMTQVELAAEINKVTSSKSITENSIGETTLQIETLIKDINKSETQISELEEKIGKLRQEKVNLESDIKLYKENTANVINSDVPKLEAINKQIGLTTQHMNNLEKFKKRCLIIERTLDASQRSAMLADLELQEQSLKKEKQNLDEAAERMSAVKKLFVSVRDSLEKQSSRAVADHVNALGPLTSLIQKRLRAVYGFGNVNLLAKGNEIRIVVDWESEHVKPADYFSESQKQILMLSIFLASRLTQTWSGFAPILMDDPVTHFDDINAFGFVELIRGLVIDSPVKHQFFISTCEDRLFELMLKKFNDVKGGAKFYRFEGIGCDGPIVRVVSEIKHRMLA